MQDTAQWGTEEGINLVAFGGGVASTLAAFLVHSVFEARCVGVFGVSRRTTEGQLHRTRTLAECLGALPGSSTGVLLFRPAPAPRCRRRCRAPSTCVPARRARYPGHLAQ